MRGVKWSMYMGTLDREGQDTPEQVQNTHVADLCRVDLHQMTIEQVPRYLYTRVTGYVLVLATSVHSWLVKLDPSLHLHSTGRCAPNVGTYSSIQWQRGGLWIWVADAYIFVKQVQYTIA